MLNNFVRFLTADTPLFEKFDISSSQPRELYDKFNSSFLVNASVQEKNLHGGLVGARVAKVDAAIKSLCPEISDDDLAGCVDIVKVVVRDQSGGQNFVQGDRRHAGFSHRKSRYHAQARLSRPGDRLRRCRVDSREFRRSRRGLAAGGKCDKNFEFNQFWLLNYNWRSIIK